MDKADRGTGRIVYGRKRQEQVREDVQEVDVRDHSLRALVAAGSAGALLTESLGLFHLIQRGPLLLAWAVILAAGAVYLWRSRPSWPKFTIRPFAAAAALAIAAIALLIAATAWLSPPNTFDAMAYHLPRVVYWAQARSVAFFPTPYLSQISAPPLAEYLMLHTYVLSGGDHFVNLVSAVAFVGCVIGVSSIAAALHLYSRSQAVAAILCATLPSGILQASGAKNDCLTALWLVCLVYFALRSEPAYAGLAFGLALATKGTAYVFAPPLAAAAFGIAWIEGRGVRRTRALGWLIAGTLLINTPQYVRNVQLSGSPLGYDAPFADGLFRWRNEHPGWKPTVSNALRHLSEQLGSGNARWNRAVYGAVLSIHGTLGIDPHSPDSPPWSIYQPPANTRHEANANNRWHLLLLLLASLYALAAARRLRDYRWLIYAAALAAAFFLFCGYLRWQPYSARLFLPLFVLAAPLAAAATSRIPWPAVAILCLFFLDGARLPLFQNWTRPLRGPHSLFTIPRDTAYFSDLPSSTELERSYAQAADRVLRSGCGAVGIDIGENQLEYPFQALLRERTPRVRFFHAGVASATVRYAGPSPPSPCAVFCLDCAGKQQKIAAYGSIGPPVELGPAALFVGGDR
jgi:hypothetical protein